MIQEAVTLQDFDPRRLNDPDATDNFATALSVNCFQPFSSPLVIMVAILFSLIGILPAHRADIRLHHPSVAPETFADR